MNSAVATSAGNFTSDSLTRQHVDHCFRLELERADLLSFTDYFVEMRD